MSQMGRSHHPLPMEVEPVEVVLEAMAPVAVVALLTLVVALVEMVVERVAVAEPGMETEEMAAARLRHLSER